MGVAVTGVKTDGRYRHALAVTVPTLELNVTSTVSQHMENIEIHVMGIEEQNP